MFKEFTIEKIAKIIRGQTKMPGLELVRGVNIDSRTTKPGHIFFALKGEHTDGHLYTSEALKLGAVAVVVEREAKAETEVLVSDTLFALGEFARYYRQQFNPKTIGITGTNGKTTVKNLIAKILGKKHRVLYAKKNYNSLIGLPLTIFELNGKEDFLILEMGTSNPGEIKRLCEIGNPQIGIITNIGPGHLKGLDSIEGVRKEKLLLLEALPEDGFGVVGEGVGAINRKNIYSFSINEAQDIKLFEYGSEFMYKGIRLFTPLLGMGNVYNCLAALTVTSILGVESNSQKEALAEIAPEPGRLQPIRHNGLLIINDCYNANPVSMKAAIDFVSHLERPKVFILGDMLELSDESKRMHIEVGEYARKHCDLLLTLDKEAQYYGGKHFNNKDALVDSLIKNLNGDEVVLVKASRALHFEEIVNELLRRY